jgi:hypothetical protein
VRLAVLTVAAAALAAPLPAAAGAAWGVQDDHLAHVPLERVDGRLELVETSRAKVARVDVLWWLVAPTRPARPSDPDDPAYEFARLDAVVRGLHQRGIVPVVAVYSAPAWAAGGRGAPAGSAVNPAAPSAAQFGAFMRALAERYDGGHRPRGADEPLPEVRHWELWNEPNLAGFLRPQFSGGRNIALSRYVQMTRRAYPLIKRANSDAVVIAGAGGPRSSTSATGTGALRWARALARSSARFDAYSQHVYPAAAPRSRTRAFPAWGTLRQLFDALDAVPRRRGMHVYITEAGYTTARTPYRDVRVSRAQQAAYLRQIARLPVVRSPRVQAVIWFNLQDNPHWPGGLRDLQGRAKPSHAAFVRVARASRLPAGLRPPRLRVSRRQLLINQRISQAAVRRLDLVQERLDRGLTRADLRPGGLGATVFGPQVRTSVAPGAPGAVPAPLARRPERPEAPRRRPGAAARVRVSAAQLLVNQRISQAAVRRADALERRLGGGLTGGDLRPGAVSADRVAAGVAILGASPSASPPAPTRTEVSRPSRRSGGTVRLSSAQLRVNQRISQVAVRRANALALRLAQGLVTTDFRRGSIGAESLDPDLRG